VCACQATEKCFAKCVPAPGTSLSSKEQACTERCVERYFEGELRPEARRASAAPVTRRAASCLAVGLLTARPTAFNLVSNAYARRVAAMREAGPDALA
jgi:hypothetical protein